MADAFLVTLDSVLHRRFVGLLPPLDSESLATELIETRQLSRALAAYGLVAACGLEDAIAAGAVTDGPGDGGLDAIYFHRSENELVLVQAKFKASGAGPAQDECLKMIAGVRGLLSRDHRRFNAAIQARFDEIEEALDTPGIKIRLLLVFLGDVVPQHSRRDMDAFCAELQQDGGQSTWEQLDRGRLQRFLIDEQAPSSITETISVSAAKLCRDPRPVVYGRLQLRDLARIVNGHGAALFERNLRGYLGSARVNTAITAAVHERPNDFFYLNNGITAVAKRIVPSHGDSYRFEGFSIVNGAQTAGAVLDAAAVNEIPADASVMLTVIEVGDNVSFATDVTRSRNYQTVVRGMDFAALDPRQEELRRELALLGYTYHYRASAESRLTREDAFTIEEAALARACIGQRPIVRARPETIEATAVSFVVAAKKEPSRLWAQDSEYYSGLFPSDLSGLALLRSVLVRRFIDRILAGSELSETTYPRRMFFRHGRYFLTMFVGATCEAVVRRSAAFLSTSEQDELSRSCNEVSELVFATAESLRIERGYLSFFRNLTDCQPLAEEVLRRLNSR